MRAKNEEAWRSLRDAVWYLLKDIKGLRGAVGLQESNVGFRVHVDIDVGEAAHLTLARHRLPLTIELNVFELH